MALAAGVEILTHPADSVSARTMLDAMRQASPLRCLNSAGYIGKRHFLMLWGYGRPGNEEIVRHHVKRGGRAILWDLGYFGRAKAIGYFRLSVDEWHPQRLMDRTPQDESRFRAHNIALRDDYSPEGHIIIAALGRKSKAYLGLHDWELRKA